MDIPAIDGLFVSACCGLSGYYYSAAPCAKTAYECPVSNAMTGAKYLPPGAYLGHSLFAMNTSSTLQFDPDEHGLLVLGNSLGRVQNSVFQCSALPQCAMSCQGVNAGLIEKASKACACMSEWYFNGYLLQISIAVITYILLNASRYAAHPLNPVYHAVDMPNNI